MKIGQLRSWNSVEGLEIFQTDEYEKRFYWFRENMNELSKYKETFEREIANLDFMKFYERTILWLFGAFCEFMCVFKVCKLY